MKFNLLVSVYHRHLKGMTVSGPKDPSARLFMVEANKYEVAALMQLSVIYPGVLRFIIDTDTTVDNRLFCVKQAVNLFDATGKTMKPELLAQFMSIAHITPFNDLMGSLVLDNLFKHGMIHTSTKGSQHVRT